MAATADDETITTSQADVDDLILDLYPLQGEWSEESYLSLTDSVNRLIEYTDGYIEVLPMPTDNHQSIVMFLYEMFVAFLRPRGGKVLVAALRIRIRPRKYREPDLVLVLDAKDPRRQNRFWLGADLVLEVVSADDPKRDWVKKRRDYAEGKIPEYWIVDPLKETISVLRLEGDAYVEHGVFGRGQQAASALLEGFAVDVSAALDAE